MKIIKNLCTLFDTRKFSSSPINFEFWENSIPRTKLKFQESQFLQFKKLSSRRIPRTLDLELWVNFSRIEILWETGKKIKTSWTYSDSVNASYPAAVVPGKPGPVGVWQQQWTRIFWLAISDDAESSRYAFVTDMRHEYSTIWFVEKKNKPNRINLSCSLFFNWSINFFRTCLRFFNGLACYPSIIN